MVTWGDDFWLSPLPGVASFGASLAMLGGLTAVSLILVDYVAAFDWDFLVQKLCLVVVWLLAFGYAFGVAHDAPPRPAGT